MTSTLRPNRTESCRFMLEWEGRELRWFVVDALSLQPAERGLLLRDSQRFFGGGVGCLLRGPMSRQSSSGLLLKDRGHGNWAWWDLELQSHCRKSSLMQQWIVTGYGHHRRHVTFCPVFFLNNFSSQVSLNVNVTPSECEHAQSGIRMHYFLFFLTPVGEGHRCNSVHECKICANRGHARGCRKSRLSRNSPLSGMSCSGKQFRTIPPIIPFFSACAITLPWIAAKIARCAQHKVLSSSQFGANLLSV